MRRSFVVQIHADGTVIVENLRTRERRPIDELTSVGDLISTWTDEAAPAVNGSRRRGVTDQREPGSGR
jgi:hypothetical protein